MNTVTLLGNLGRDPETTITQNGTKIANASIATYAGKDRPPDWHRLVGFSKTADFLAGAKKGDCICVEGRIQYRDWTDKDGNKRTSTEIVVGRVHFTGPRSRGDGESTPDSGQGFNEEEIPF